MPKSFGKRADFRLVVANRTFQKQQNLGNKSGAGPACHFPSPAFLRLFPPPSPLKPLGTVLLGCLRGFRGAPGRVFMISEIRETLGWMSARWFVVIPLWGPVYIFFGSAFLLNVFPQVSYSTNDALKSFIAIHVS